MIDVATLMAAAALVAVILAWLMPAQWALASLIRDGAHYGFRRLFARTSG